MNLQKKTHLRLWSFLENKLENLQMSDAGWLKLHRALIDWEWFKTPNMVHFWIYCLMKANHATKKWQGIEILPGQFVSGRDAMSLETGIGEQSIRTCINRLKSTNELTSKSTNKYTIFTIISWKKYQLDEDSNQQINQQLTSSQPATNQQLTTNKNVKNVKNVKKDLSEQDSDEGLTGEISKTERQKKETKKNKIWEAVKVYWNFCPGGSEMGRVVRDLENIGATPFAIWAVWHGWDLVRPGLTRANPHNFASIHFGQVRDDLMKEENKLKLVQKITSQKIEIPFAESERIWK